MSTSTRSSKRPTPLKVVPRAKNRGPADPFPLTRIERQALDGLLTRRNALDQEFAAFQREVVARVGADPNSRLTITDINQGLAQIETPDA